MRGRAPPLRHGFGPPAVFRSLVRRVPLSHRRLSVWYHQLAQQLEAGLPLAEALRLSGGTGMPAAQLDAMAGRIAQGGSTEDALRAVESWLPRGDLLALSAAADAGRMPRALHHLSLRHAQLGAAKLKILVACAYPVGVLHFGLLLLPVLQLVSADKGFQWNALAYARGVLAGVLPLWGGVAVVWILARRGSPLLARAVRAVPVLGGYVRKQALADFSFVLANLVEAGVPIGRAWAAAGLVTRSPELKAAAADMTAVVASGAPPGGRLGAWACFPPEFVALYRTGEQTGQLEVNLHRLAAHNQEAAGRALTLMTVLVPVGLFLIVAAAVAYHAVSIYGGYVKSLGKLLD
jgi:type II secretory pathway component PulF